MTRLALPAALIVVCVWTPARAQDPQPARIAFDNHAFRFVLKRSGVEPVDSLDELDPAQGVLIVWGDLNAVPEDERLRFLQAGGAALFATDPGDQRNPREFWLTLERRTRPRQGLHFVGKLVKVPDAEDGYQGNADCPIVVDFKRDEARVPIFKGIHKIATNRPGYLNPTTDDFLQIAHFPQECVIDRKTQLGFAAVHNRHRILGLSDHSVFINTMMMQNDNDNFLFAINCVRWLTEDGKRKKVLFIDEGRVVTSFDVSVQEMPVAIPGDPVDFVNALLRKWESHNVHNQLLLDLVGRDAHSRILIVLAAGCTIALLIYGFFRLHQAQHRMETS